MDQLRFDEIVSVLLANLASDITQFAHIQRDSCLADVSDCGGAVGVALMGSKLDSDELQEFSEQFAAKFAIFGAVSPCMQKIQNDLEKAIRATEAKAAVLSKLSPTEIKLLGL